MKFRTLPALAIVVLMIAAWWLWHDPSTLRLAEHEAARENSPPLPNQAVSPDSASRTESPTSISQVEQARTGSPLATELNAPNGSAAQDVDILRQLIGQYLTALQRKPGPPIGDDHDLVHVLTGHNPLHLTVIPATHPAISPQGRLLDRFGTPYLVHPVSSHNYQIRSAGPDRKLFTLDDVVAPDEESPQ